MKNPSQLLLLSSNQWSLATPILIYFILLFILLVPSEPSSSDATFENSTCIKLTWSGTACVRSYSIVTNNTSEDIVNGQTYFYCPQSSGDYIFQVASINYFGERVPGSDNAVYHWQGIKFYS